VSVRIPDVIRSTLEVTAERSIPLSTTLFFVVECVAGIQSIVTFWFSASTVINATRSAQPAIGASRVATSPYE